MHLAWRVSMHPFYQSHDSSNLGNVKSAIWQAPDLFYQALRSRIEMHVSPGASRAEASAAEARA